MREAERQAYRNELRAAAKRVGLPLVGDIEEALIARATRIVDDWISAHGSPKNLCELLAGVATSFCVEIVEVSCDADLHKLLNRIPPSGEPVLARVAGELDNDTDAVIIQRQNRQPWEMPYLAIINCRGWHAYRKYFSKWHEVVHLFLDGEQLRFAFRTTSSRRKHPQEILVDKIAGVLAFHPRLFEPALREELNKSGRLTFDGVERLRQAVAPEASRDATVNACVRICAPPTYFLKAKMKLKRGEERQLEGLFGAEDDGPIPKLRIDVANASPSATSLGIRIHENVEVPADSFVMAAFNNPGRVYRGEEKFDRWRTSNGALGQGTMFVEAIGRGGRDVSCLLTFLTGARGGRPRSTRPAA